MQTRTPSSKHAAFAIHSDHLGTPRMATDLNGELAWSAEYDPFGKATVSSTSTIVLPYRFPTHYNYFRDYDPGTGRYITSDPIGLEGGLNTYAYALNDPLGLTDRLGLDPDDEASSTDESPAKPTAADEQGYTDKLVKVLNYAIASLPNQADSAAKQVLENLKQEAIFMGVIIAAVAFNPAAAPIVLAGAWLLAGYSAAKFIYDAVGMLVALRNTNFCNETALQNMGNELASSIGVGGALRSAAEYAGQGAWRLWRSLKERFNRDVTNGGICSFDGSTLVITDSGYKPIKDIQAQQDRVWAKDEVSGRMGWKTVLAQYSNRYEETVHVTAISETGKSQTITSNRIHPYFARVAAGAILATASVATTQVAASEGHVYAGDIAGGAWVDAQHLKPGDELLSAANQWQSVEAVVVEQQPLEAYNLTVDDYSTYFVGGASDVDAVWVHNTCYVGRPRGFDDFGKDPITGQNRITDENGRILYQGDPPNENSWYDLPNLNYTKVSVDDPAADEIARRLGGESRVKFPGRFNDREFDVVTDTLLGQTKPANFQLGSAFRNQAKATFEAALEIGRTPYFHFDGPPSPAVIAKLQEYAQRYGIDPIIDTTPL